MHVTEMRTGTRLRQRHKQTKDQHRNQLCTEHTTKDNIDNKATSYAVQYTNCFN